jgi:hypothetical protein
MMTIETIGTVSPEGELVVKLPKTLPPGEHHVVVVIETEAASMDRGELPTVKVGEWPEGFTFRREDIYGDEGR